MPWPPTLPPNNNTDSTPQGAGYHAETLHNTTANALADIVDRIDEVAGDAPFFGSINGATNIVTNPVDVIGSAERNVAGFGGAITVPAGYTRVRINGVVARFVSNGANTEMLLTVGMPNAPVNSPTQRVRVQSSPNEVPQPFSCYLTLTPVAAQYDSDLYFKLSLPAAGLVSTTFNGRVLANYIVHP